jgi:hypothetical protein
MKEKASAHFARNDGRRELHRLKPVLPSAALLLPEAPSLQSTNEKSLSRFRLRASAGKFWLNLTNY